MCKLRRRGRQSRTGDSKRGDCVTKSERLIFLINTLASGQPIYVERTARECGVTGRTIYRDLESLAQMDYPIVYHNNGYRLDGDAKSVNRQLSQDEIDLLHYCLNHNPLAVDPYFRDTFRVILQSVNTRPHDGSSLARKLFVIDPSYRADGLDGVGHQHIATFARAAILRHKIDLRMRAGRKLSECVPLIVRFHRDSIRFVVACMPDWNREEVRVDQVKKVELLNKKFRRRPSEVIRAQRSE